MHAYAQVRRRFERARALYRRALVLERRHTRTLLNFGVLEGKHLGNVSKAARMFERVLDLEPRNADAQAGFMHCQAVLEGAVLHDTEDPSFERFVYNNSANNLCACDACCGKDGGPTAGCKASAPAEQ